VHLEKAHLQCKGKGFYSGSDRSPKPPPRDQRTGTPFENVRDSVLGLGSHVLAGMEVEWNALVHFFRVFFAKKSEYVTHESLSPRMC
jgi:hypothetical protein